MERDRVFSFYIDGNLSLRRIDVVLREVLDIPRNQIQQWIACRHVTVNGRSVKKNYVLRKFDEVTIRIPEPKEPLVQVVDAPVSIIYEDNDIIVVDKPSGLVVHPGAGYEERSVVGALLFRGIELSNIGAPLRMGVVHRIDKGTSGVLVLAKNERSHFVLANQFFKHTILRKYIGIVEGHCGKESGIVDAPVGRHPVKRKEFGVFPKGKPAVTHYKVLLRGKEHDVVLFRLETGRTHQIRVHMSHIHHPILGDTVYGHSSPLINRQALHAALLGFRHPSSGDDMVFASSLSEDMKKLILGGKL